MILYNKKKTLFKTNQAFSAKFSPGVGKKTMDPSQARESSSHIGQVFFRVTRGAKGIEAAMQKGDLFAFEKFLRKIPDKKFRFD